VPKVTEQIPPQNAQTDPGETAVAALLEFVQLLPDLAVTILQAAPHGCREHTSLAALTSRQTRVVIHLAHRPSITMSELAEGLGIGRAATTELVARLEDKGLVRREYSENDRRIVRVRLARQAEGYAEKTIHDWAASIAPTFARFPSIDPATLADLLRALMDEWKDVDA